MDALRKLDPDRPVYVEAESKKIGQLQLPDALLTRMRESPCVLIEAPLAERVAFLVGEYGHFLGDPRDLKNKLDCLSGLHSRDTLARWMKQVEERRWDELVADLLANHYDPAYRRATLRNFAHLAQARVLRPSKLDFSSLEQLAAQFDRGGASMNNPQFKSRLLQLFLVFKKLPAAAVEEIVRSAVARQAPAGSILFEAASPCTGFPMLLEGSVRAVKAAPSGREVQLYRITPGRAARSPAAACLAAALTRPPASPRPR